MNVLIVEDEKPAARRLSRILEKQDIQVDQMLHSVAEAKEWFTQNDHPDLIFLDIQLSDGLSFEIFEEIEIQSAIIFTTAYDEYALRAFKLNSIDYLLKPIDEEELANALEKYKSFQPKQQDVTMSFNDIKRLLSGEPEQSYKKRFTVKVGQHLKMIPVEDIECFYSENKGTYLFTKEGRNYLLETTLEHMEQELDPNNFFRISRKFFVNINAIKDIVAYTNSRLKVILQTFNEQELIVSRERVKSFKNWLS